MKQLMILGLLFHFISCDNRVLEIDAAIGGGLEEANINVYTTNLTIQLDSVVTIYIETNEDLLSMNFTNSSQGILQDSTGQLITQNIYIEGNTIFYYQPQLLGGQELTFTFSKADNTSTTKAINFTVIP